MGEARAGKGGGQLQGAAGRRHASAPHVVAEGGEGQRLGDLGLGDVGAAAVAAVEVAVADELVERRPDRQARDPEVDRELALGGDGLPDGERLDQVEDPVAGLFLLTHWKWYCPLELTTREVKHKRGKWSIPLLGRGAASVPSVGVRRTRNANWRDSR